MCCVVNAKANETMNYNNYIKVDIADKKVRVFVNNKHFETTHIITSSREVKEGWNFFALNFKNLKDGHV